MTTFTNPSSPTHISPLHNPFLGVLHVPAFYVQKNNVPYQNIAIYPFIIFSGVFFFENMSCCVAQLGLELWNLNNPPALISPVQGL
jgi:hypothetical protein